MSHILGDRDARSVRRRVVSWWGLELRVILHILGVGARRAEEERARTDISRSFIHKCHVPSIGS